MGSRTWIKIYCDRWLEGTLRKESLELRGGWADILALAGKSNYGDAGEIKVTKNIGLSDEIIASIMKISQEKWREIKAKLVKTGRIRVLKNNVIKIVKWHKYQSEYGRTKDMPSRISTKSTTKSTDKSTTKSTKEIEREREIEIENTEKGEKLDYSQLQQKTDNLCKTLTTYFRKFNFYAWRQEQINKQRHPEGIEECLILLWKNKGIVINVRGYLTQLMKIKGANAFEREAITEHEKRKEEELSYDRKTI